MQFVSDDPEKSVTTFLLTAAVNDIPTNPITILAAELWNVDRRLLGCCSSGAARFRPPKVDVRLRSEVCVLALSTLGLAC